MSTRMKNSGYDWRCPCGWRTGRVRTAVEVTSLVTEHRREHDIRNATLAARAMSSTP